MGRGFRLVDGSEFSTVQQLAFLAHEDPNSYILIIAPSD
jgi:hypothetical protein